MFILTLLVNTLG